MSCVEDSKHFRYLDLPAELQLRIIHFAVTGECSIDTSSDNDKAKERHTAQPAMTKVNRSIRADALPDFYRTSTFTWCFCPWDKLEALPTWLTAIGAANRHNVRSLILQLDGSCCSAEEDEIDVEKLRKRFEGMQACVTKVHGFEYRVTFA